MNRLNLVGNKFGRLTVIKLHHIKGGSYWLCKCDCGKKSIVYVGDLRSNHTKSCGCLHLEKIESGCNFKHGLEGTRFYGIWSKILRRIRNKNCKEYKYYGGRGIKVCEKWLDFTGFRDDMYQSYLQHCKEFGEKNTTINRIKNENDYYYANCEWSTLQEQSENKRTSIYISYNGETMLAKKACKIAGIGYHTFYNRLKLLKWTPEKSISKPVS
jgi:hypothetical protein